MVSEASYPYVAHDQTCKESVIKKPLVGIKGYEVCSTGAQAPSALGPRRVRSAAVAAPAGQRLHGADEGSGDSWADRSLCRRQLGPL
jgi:hypothetical protein